MKFIKGQRWKFISKSYHILVEALDTEYCKVLYVFRGSMTLGTTLRGPYSDEKIIKSLERDDISTDKKVWIYLEGQDAPNK